MKRLGFTLLELLVMIAIITILAAFLFPVFARAKAAAGDAKTISNSRQLAIGADLYMQDADDFYCPATDGSMGTNLAGGWIFYSTFGNTDAGVFDVKKGVLFPYMTSTEVYKSPADRDSQTSGDSFAINGYLTQWNSTGLNPGKAASTVPYPSGTMLFGEEGSGAPQLIGYGYSNGTNDGYFNPSTDNFAKFHPGGAAVVFCDSHAKILQAEDHFVETICGTSVACY